MSDIMDQRISEYDDMLETYRALEKYAADIIEHQVCSHLDGVMQVAHRIKTRESVLGKLHKKPEKYTTVSMMTDIVGFRVICYFADQVDLIAAELAAHLQVDWERSTDKRAMIAPDAFGYLSLHYICLLPGDQEYPDALSDLPFEIQIRSVLQHTWAEIEHDLGYKTRFGVPRDVRREFSRVAGLLELADEAFLHIKSRITEYQKEVYERITNDRADDLHLDLVSLKEYMKRSHGMVHLLTEISLISGARILDTDPEDYLEQLDYLNVHTLGDLNRLLESEQEHALAMASELLKIAEIDELVSTVGLYYLCRARLVYGDYDGKAIAGFFLLRGHDREQAQRQAEYLLARRRRAI
ncbi:MAG: hypothetical protein IJ600_05990 [Lachnospiraceae bacterium]|nr:hypothetical protein [Lachnospiraceae bacterium]